MSNSNFSNMISSLMPLFVLMVVMGMMTGVMGGALGSNPGNPDKRGKRERKLFTKLKEQIKDEEDAFHTYLDMAREADELGMFNLASELRHIARQEFGHRDTLREFYSQITEIPIAEVAAIPPKYVEIIYSGDTTFKIGEIVSYEALVRENDRVRLIGGRLAEGKALPGR